MSRVLCFIEVHGGPSTETWQEFMLQEREKSAFEKEKLDEYDARLRKVESKMEGAAAKRNRKGRCQSN